MNHDEFIAKLGELGFIVKPWFYDPGSSNIYLIVNGVRISTKDYHLFGFYCGGVYAQCNRTDQDIFDQDDIEAAVKCSAEVLTEMIINTSKLPDFWDCRKYCNEHFTGTKLKEDSTKRVFKFLKDNLRELSASVKPHNPNP